MKRIPLFVCFLLVSLAMFTATGSLSAEDMVKVLIAKDPGRPGPSVNSETVNSFKGKIFIDGQTITGSFDVIKDDNGLYVVKKLPLREYLKTAVISEICSDWSVEAIKAQAVISRTYAVYHITGNENKVYHLSYDISPRQHPGEKREEYFVAFALNETEGEILPTHKHPEKRLYKAQCGEARFPDELRDKSYTDILSHLFPGARIKNVKERYSRAITP